jgi:hypothetical protein
MVALVKRYGSERMLINSAADWGISDSLKVPKTAQCMLNGGIPEPDVERIVWHNPVAFFSQSGRLDLSGHRDQNTTGLWEGNSVLRGQAGIPALG